MHITKKSLKIAFLMNMKKNFTLSKELPRWRKLFYRALNSFFPAGYPRHTIEILALKMNSISSNFLFR